MKHPLRYLIFLFFIYSVASFFALLLITWLISSEPLTLSVVKENLSLGLILGVIGGGGIWSYVFFTQKKS